ncbi:MAG: pyridoxamine 5-phosphate oxidase [Ilumatobacteraceae bacterium]|nr:pyridoxamine 5-phosphate oxidase [Ilumatobacteraceae bacterium]
MNEIGPPRLQHEQICWLATVRPDGRAHLSPIWFVWLNEAFWLCCNTDTVKARNMRANPNVAVSLESGSDPLVVEGQAVLHARPYPDDVIAAFKAKFDWNIRGDEPDPDGDFGVLVQIGPTKWVMGKPTSSEVS